MKKKSLVLLIIIIVIATIVGFIIYKIAKRNNSKNIIEGTYISTEQMKEKAPLIDMNNLENAEIQNGEKINSSKKLEESKEISGIIITNIKLYTESGISNFYAIAKNNTGEDFKGGIVNLKFKNNDGSILASVEAILPPIKAKNSATINTSTAQDIVNASDVEIEFIS